MGMARNESHSMLGIMQIQESPFGIWQRFPKVLWETRENS